MKSKSLEDLCKERYGDDHDLCAMVIADADRHGTRDAIEDGKMTIPSLKDARHHHERLTGVADHTAVERNQAATITTLQERISRLESVIHPAAPPANVEVR